MNIYVVDASTVVSAALNPNGTPRHALAAARSQGVIALSEAVYDEIAEVLSRPKFARVLTEDRRRETLELPAAAALWFEPKEHVTDCRDTKDNPYLELALAARATAIVSGDEDLLVLDPWRGIRVLRPARFLEHLGKVEP
ncbi:MAG: putative toxin-antitoxin system toxin component, PIN family [Janthinobacterium lividum]